MNKVKKILFSCLLICCLLFVTFGATACNNNNMPETTEPKDQTNADLILSSIIDGVTYDFISATAFSDTTYLPTKSGNYYTGVDLYHNFDVTLEINVNNTSSQAIKMLNGAGDSLITYNEEMKFCYDSIKNLKVSTQINTNVYDDNTTITVASKTNKVVTISFKLILYGPVHYDLNNYTSNVDVRNFVGSKSKSYYGQNFEQKSQLLQETFFAYRRGETDVIRFKINANNITELDFS